MEVAAKNCVTVTAKVRYNLSASLPLDLDSPCCCRFVTQAVPGWPSALRNEWFQQLAGLNSQSQFDGLVAGVSSIVSTDLPSKYWQITV